MERLIEARDSMIHGVGCYAIKPIPCGELIIEYVGELIDLDEAVRRHEKTHPKHSEYILEVQDNIYIDGIRGNESRFVNHSCDPNCSIVTMRNRAFIMATRDIEIGEELTYDYMYDEDVRDLCACAKESCRGYI